MFKLCIRWAEQSPNDLLNSVKICLEESAAKAKELNISFDSIKGILLIICVVFLLDYILAIGLTNQRETTVCWDAVTGEPLAPALGKPS